MPDGRWKLGGVMGGIPAPIPYILRRGAFRMGTQKLGAAVRERNTFREAVPGMGAERSEDLGSITRTKRIRLPQMVVFLLRELYELSAYRRPMQVREFIFYPSMFGTESEFFLCPRCDITMEREYQSYCDRCGQHLGWRCIGKAKERHRAF